MGVLSYLCCGKSRDSFFDSSSGTVGSSEDDIPPQPVELHDVPVKGTTAMPPHRIAPIPRPTIRLLTANSPSASTHSGVNTSRDVHRQSVISEVAITPVAIDYSTRALQLQYILQRYGPDSDERRDFFREEALGILEGRIAQRQDPISNETRKAIEALRPAVQAQAMMYD